MASIKSMIPSRRRYLTVEPAVFLVFFGWLMYFPIGQIYIYQRVSDRKGFPYRNVSQGAEGSGCAGEDLGKNSSFWQLEKEVQVLASKINLGYNLVVTIPSILVGPLWGPWTDSGGRRKPALQVAILGACLAHTVSLLVVYFEWSVYILFVSAAISGFSGFAPVLMLGATSYIADTSGKEERAFRIAVLYLAVFIAGVISQLTSGLWIENLGFIPVAWFILSCSLLSGIWTLFCVPESPRATEGTVGRFFSPENYKTFFNLFRKPREAGRKNLILLMVCDGIMCLTGLGIDGVQRLYVLKSPLCWSPTLSGYYSAFAMFVHGVGGAAGVKFLGRCLKELKVTRIGMVTVILSSALLAFSDRTWMVFLVGLVGVFNGVISPILVGGMSKIVQENEQGSLFSAYYMITAAMQLAGAALFNTVYQATLGTFHGLVFILCAVLVLIPFTLVSFIELPSPVNDNETCEKHDIETESGTHY